jgi:hypothetical protein
MSICDRVFDVIGNFPNDMLQSYSNGDLAILKPKLFVEGVNQFDCYHFVIPRIEVSSFFVDKKRETFRGIWCYLQIPDKSLKPLLPTVYIEI